MVSSRVYFYGKVQGVWFRANCQKMAISEGVNGWVRNLPDKSVELYMEGSKKAIIKLIERCKNKQPFAYVSRVDIEWFDKEKGLNDFIIKR